MVEQLKGENLKNQNLDKKEREEQKMNKKETKNTKTKEEIKKDTMEEVEEKTLTPNENDIVDELDKILEVEDETKNNEGIEIKLLDEEIEEDSNISNDDDETSNEDEGKIELNVPKPKKVNVEKRGGNAITIATYPYQDKEGKILFEIDKRKGGRQPYYIKYKKSEKDKEYIYGLPRNIEIPIYNLPKVREGIEEGRAIWVLEGESKVDVMTKLGFIATTVPFKGPNTWKKYHNEYLEGAENVIVFYDNDEESRDFKDLTKLTIGEDPDIGNVYEVGVKDFYKDIKEGGDIEDLVELLGKERVQVTLETYESNF